MEPDIVGTVTNAAGAAAPGLDPALLMPLVTAAVPIVLAVVRKVAAKIPTWVIPIAAPFLGASIDVLLYQVGVYGQQQPLVGAFFGMAGVGLREIVDQMRKATTQPVPPPGG